jgi:hypothetical protein
MIKLKSILLENNILISRRNTEERLKYYRAALYKKVKNYIKNGCKGDLDLSYTPIDRLPDELTRVGGNLELEHTNIKKLPDTLTNIDGCLDIASSDIKSLPSGLTIRGHLYADNASIEELAPDIKVYDYVSLFKCPISRLPDNLYVENSLFLNFTRISEIPNNLHVGRSLHVSTTPLYKKYTIRQIEDMIIDKGGFLGGDII